ncbi:MAG: hypothetical protein MJ062_01195 [Oscillospiraceae bacterium]|nr:hypothetical protein [Oscillospiraceae bacterium]
MKKLFTVLTAVSILGSICALPVSADDTAFLSAFFQSENISTPADAPYIYADKSDGCGTLEMFYEVPDDLIAMCSAYQELGDTGFSEKYGVNINRIGIQIDTHFEDTDWISRRCNWDIFYYMPDIDFANPAFSLSDMFWAQDTAKLHHYTQSNLAAFDETTGKCDYFADYRTEDGKSFDFTEHTIFYRYRCFVTYFLPDFDGEYPCDSGYVLFSDWSPETVIGLNGTQQALPKPTAVDAPTLSDFSMVKNGDSFSVSYYLDVPDSIYDGETYFLTEGHLEEPYQLETQMRVDDGEWETPTAEACPWLTSGSRTAESAAGNLTEDNHVELRARLVCNGLDGMASEWSNEIGTNPTMAAEEPQDSGFLHPTDCTICGFCPQPMGYCIFLWIAAGAVLLILLIIIVSAVSSKKKKKKAKKAKLAKQKKSTAKTKK